MRRTVLINNKRMMNKKSVWIFLVLLVRIIRVSNPVAIFHGLGDACAIEKITGLPAFIRSQLNNTHVECVESGGTIFSIMFKSFPQQAEQGCEKIKNNPEFRDKNITVIGLSQGALVGRYIAQKCEFGGKVVNLVTIGGPNMGVDGLPHCQNDSYICRVMNHFIAMYVAYNTWSQRLIGPAGYYRAHQNYQQYKEKSSFLVDLNNEREIDQENRNRFKSIEQLILIKFNQDQVIIPRETSWFQSYKLNDQGFEVEKIEDSQFYKDDYLGLKYLDDQNRVKRYEVEGDHLQIDKEELIDYVIENIK